MSGTSLAWSRYLPSPLRRKLEESRHLHEVISNTGWMMGDKVVRMGVGLLVGVWLARYLGPERYGVFSYAYAFAALFSPVAMLGLDEIVIRRLVRDGSQSDEILGTVFVLMLMGGGAATLLAGGAIFLVRPGDLLMRWLVLIITGGTLFQAFLAIEFWFESQLRWKYTVYAKLTAFLAISAVKLLLILGGFSLVAFAWAGLAETFLGCAGLVLAYRASGRSLARWRYGSATAAGLLRDSWPVILSVFLTMIYLKIDQVMLGSMADSGELGLYSAAVRLTESWGFIPMAICSSLFPGIALLEGSDEREFNGRIQRLYNMMAFSAYCIAIPVALFSGLIVRLLFSDAYEGSGPLLSLLIWSLLFTNLGAARNVYMVSRNWLRVNLLSTLLGCVANVILNYLLIPTHGATGAIAASLFSYWLAVHGTCFLFKPLRRTGWMLTKAMLYPRIW